MKMSLIQTIINWKRSFLLLGIIPVIFIGVIYIVYGYVFNPFFTQGNTAINFLKLSNQFSLLNSAISIPQIVKIIGKLSTVFLYVIFVLWLCFHIIISYLKLSRQMAFKPELIVELILISLVYLIIISPLNILVYLLGCLVLLLNLALIIFYWIYQLRAKQ
jgi:hypothetical protein